MREGDPIEIAAAAGEIKVRRKDRIPTLKSLVSQINGGEPLCRDRHGTCPRKGNSCMVTRYVPRAGDYVWLGFDPQAGREQSKCRPALFIRDQNYKRASGLAVVCPLTSRRRPYPFALPTVCLTHRSRRSRRLCAGRSSQDLGLGCPQSRISFQSPSCASRQGAGLSRRVLLGVQHP
jgi:hypothetical protein